MSDVRNAAPDLEIVDTLAPLHPGEVLREEFLKPHGLSAGKVAKALGVPRTRIERVEREEIGITTDTAVRLGIYFGTTTQFWLNLQARYDAESSQATREALAAVIEPLPA
ncbi:HigA family addiction module antitoxin [Methylopila turkensis]|uniref:Transcriptional regulator n=1 Tax=Methylopila turkensis TaxID=1437816 RepID=A0A9W6JRA0_9HYPH|nr:HigA family addiction module antitoxin [Methylopila turkensis]GLK81003.1 transcriptional regulator [Methylopila turkensis]